MNFRKEILLKDALLELKNNNQIIFLQLKNGKEYCGKIEDLGDHFLYLKMEGNRSYYNALIDITQVASVEIKVRGE
jgi:small nuclear ribonucleoprotein (snRNP)-like protein